MNDALANPKIDFDNSYRQLPDRFYQTQNPIPVVSPGLVRINQKLAEELGLSLDWLSSNVGLQTLAGNAIPDGAEPIATVYAGHQFGSWNPQLGDGRAVLLGEVCTPSGKRVDLQLKGSGPTPYSRGGDGRAPIGPVLREYIVSEAMFALGVPTSRSLAAVTTGESVIRDEALPGAVLTRVSSSHIRFGTFQFFTSRGDSDAVRDLADHVIARHYPDVQKSANPYLDLFRHIMDRTAALVAKWQQLGFIHGVMNTDNMLICGETIDYGPCAFMDTYHPEKVFSSIDVGGRYAYQNQPGIAHWNLAALAQCFTSLLSENEEEAVEAIKTELDQFPDIFYAYHRKGMAQKIGFTEASETTDELIRDLLGLMATHELDFTITFRELTSALTNNSSEKLASLGDWLTNWQAAVIDKQISAEVMRKVNPTIIPRNHHIETAIQAAQMGDFQPFHNMAEALTTPFDDFLLDSIYAQAPEDSEVVQKTFCGT